MLQKGIIRKSTSPLISPVALVKKKTDNKPRFCVDFRELNKLNSRPMWPLLRVEDAVSSFGNSNYFTSLYSDSGFWQIEMSERGMSKRSFVTIDGQFEFVHVPFGLSGATAIF